MALTFNPPMPPQTAPTGQGRFAVQEIQFGDGYIGTMEEGLNNHRRTWPVSYKGSIAEIEAIEDFFKLHGGSISFQWVPPMGAMGLWRVTEYDMIPESGDNATITATFKESFKP